MPSRYAVPIALSERASPVRIRLVSAWWLEVVPLSIACDQHHPGLLSVLKEVADRFLLLVAETLTEDKSDCRDLA